MCRRRKTKCSSERPCSRCVRLRVPEPCVDFDSAEEVLRIERPFRFRGGVALFEPAQRGEQEWLDQLLVDSGLHWIAGPVQRCFELGLDVHKVVRMFSTLPECWVALLKDTCSAVRVLDHQQRLQQGLQSDSLVEAQAQCLSALEESQVLLDKVWESSTNVGMMRVGFCPEQTKRRSTFVTTYWSRFTNLHTEEVISRLANREFDLWFTEVEYLCLLIDELTRGATLPTMASYMRLHLRDSSMLIKLLRIHTRDHLNRVIQAQYICEPVTIEEWDEAAQKRPHIVRPYMMAAGDKRNGAALLADMEADMERMRIVNLTRTAEGSAFLRRLLRYA